MTLLQPTRPPARDDADVTTVRTRPRWVVPAATASLLAVAVATGAIGTTMLRGDGEQAANTTSADPPPGDGTAQNTTTGDTGTKSGGTKSGSGTASTSGSGSASAAGSTSGSATSPTKVTGMREIPVSQGVAKLRAAGIAPYGKAQLAMSWTDRNGENVVLTSRKDAATTDGNGTTWRTANLRIVHVAHLDSKPVVLRTMNDPSGAPCEFDLTNDVAGDYAIAGDLNGDGYAELSVSWSSSCLSEADRSVAKTALLSNGHKYIVRGLGWPGGEPDGPGDWPAARITSTEPAAGQWPAGFHLETQRVWLRLFH
jgi:hypothetical protein